MTRRVEPESVNLTIERWEHLDDLWALRRAGVPANKREVRVARGTALERDDRREPQSDVEATAAEWSSVVDARSRKLSSRRVGSLCGWSRV